MKRIPIERLAAFRSTYFYLQIALLLLMLLISYYIVFQIDFGNEQFYHGKDNGITIQIYSILIYSVLIHCFVPLRKILRPIIGFLTGIFTIICIYFITETSSQFQYISISLVSISSLLQTYFFHKK